MVVVVGGDGEEVELPRNEEGMCAPRGRLTGGAGPIGRLVEGVGPMGRLTGGAGVMGRVAGGVGPMGRLFVCGPTAPLRRDGGETVGPLSMDGGEAEGPLPEPEAVVEVGL